MSDSFSTKMYTAQALEGNRSLHKLEISNNSITSAGKHSQKSVYSDLTERKYLDSNFEDFWQAW
jgi:hypothetical protein